MIRTGVTGLAAAVVLAFASSAAFAQPTVPPNPVVGNGPSPAGNNSGLYLTAWNPTTQVSLVKYLGLNLNDVLEPAMTPDTGLTLDFGTIEGFTATFGSGAGVFWHVTAFDAVNSSGTDPTRLVTTASGPFSIEPPATSQAAQAGASFVQSLVAAAQGTNPYVGSAGSGFYAGTLLWGENLGNNLPVSAAAAVGTALQFFYMEAIPDTFDGAPAVIYQNATAFAQWLLGTDGHLTYSISGEGPVVPLPAAVWLLLSGLAGLTAISRRRSAVAA